MVGSITPEGIPTIFTLPPGVEIMDNPSTQNERSYRTFVPMLVRVVSIDPSDAGDWKMVFGHQYIIREDGRSYFLTQHTFVKNV